MLPPAGGRGLEVLGVSTKGVSPVGWNLQAGPSPLGMGVSPAAAAAWKPEAPLLPPGRFKVRRTKKWRPPAAAGGAACPGEACRVLKRNLQAETVTAHWRARRRGVLKASWHLQAEAATS